jgi:hypothetical protein
MITTCWIVMWVRLHILSLNVAKPILEAALAKCVPTVGKTFRIDHSDQLILIFENITKLTCEVATSVYYIYRSLCCLLVVWSSLRKNLGSADDHIEVHTKTI